MYIIEIRILASEQFSEVVSEVEAESAVEDIVGCALLQIFDTLCIEKVSIRRLSTEEKETEQSNHRVN